MLFIGRGRAFDYLPWYHAAPSVAVAPLVPDQASLVNSVRWGLPIYGVASPTQFRKKMEIEDIGVFLIDKKRIDYFFPHLAPATVYAIQDISLANGMAIRDRIPQGRHWRRSDGKLERIVYPPRPTLAELMEGAA
jgi:hypothetical protein